MVRCLRDEEVAMIRAMIDLLSSHYHSGDWSNVEAIARSILAAVPDDHVSLQFLGLAYYKSGRIADAVRIFTGRQRPEAHDQPLRLRFGQGYLSRDDYAAAAACYEAATRRDPQLAAAWHDLGKAQVDLMFCRQAINAFRAALIADPTRRDSMRALGRAGLACRDLAAAEEGYATLARAFPDDPAGPAGLGRVCRHRREFMAARSYYRRAAALRARRDSGPPAPAGCNDAAAAPDLNTI